MYGQSRKDVFERYCLCKSNFATLNLNAAVMQQRASTWVDFISPCGYLPFIYIIRCTSQQWVCSLSVYGSVIVNVVVIVSLGTAPWCIDISSLAWAGLTLLILIKGQCEGLTAGISTRETYSHVFFVSIVFVFEFGQFGERLACTLLCP